MISLYVGLPGSGKTTLMSKLAVQHIKRGIPVFCNVHLDIDSPLFHFIENSFIGVYHLEGGLVLLDEGEIFAEARSYKSFPKSMSDWFMLHRHYRCNVAIFCQRYKGVDVKIRNLANKLYLVRRSAFGFTRTTPIEYTLLVPKSGDKAGEIVEGYRLPGFFGRIFSTRWTWRRKYYKYFDSWAAPQLLPLPEEKKDDV